MRTTAFCRRQPDLPNRGRTRLAAVRILVLGGTGWLGSELATAGLARGAIVACAARGSSGVAPDRCAFHQVDRRDSGWWHGLDPQSWDVVIDVASDPRLVRDAAQAFASVARTYVYISSISVYADHSRVGGTESDAVVTPLDPAVQPSAQDYAAAKARCELEVTEAIAERALIVRPGLIGGPGDPTCRTTYWPWRFAHPVDATGRVIIPDDPHAWTQVIDVRDLAQWVIEAAATRLRGVVDAVGEQVPLGTHLLLAREVGGHGGPVLALPGPWLVDEGVAAWAGTRSLPLWLGGDPGYAGLGARSGALARSLGLTTRPLRHTLRDGLNSLRHQPMGSGLTDDEERALLARWDFGAAVQSP